MTCKCGFEFCFACGKPYEKAVERGMLACKACEPAGCPVLCLLMSMPWWAGQQSCWGGGHARIVVCCQRGHHAVPHALRLCQSPLSRGTMLLM